MKDIVPSEDSDLIFFLKDHGLYYTVEANHLFRIARLKCSFCSNYEHYFESLEYKRHSASSEDDVYSNILKADFNPNKMHITKKIKIFYDHIYQKHGYTVHSKEPDEQRDIIVKIIQQLIIFHNEFKHYTKNNKDKDKQLERKIKLGQCIRFLNKDCAIPIRVIEFCFNMSERQLGNYAYFYMKYKEGLPNWAKSL